MMTVNNELERMWKEVVIAYLRYYPGICLEELRKTTERHCQDSQSLGWDLNLGPLPPKK
jgi:hypothetical protein